MTKKAIGLLLVLGLSGVLAACGGGTTDAPADAPAETPLDAPAETPLESPVESPSP
jgi:ABC-type glycerol-3-phosphate transport system substrate-binding protein